MRPGTPGFVGERLTEAREARGLTRIALADVLGVSRQAVAQFESGAASPSPESMRRVCEVLDLPLRFFLIRPRDRKQAPIFFRSQAAATKGARTRACRRIDWLMDVAEYIQSWVRLPAVKIPCLRFPANPTMIGKEAVRDAANITRAELGAGTGPIGNAAWLVENAGVVVARFPLFADELDGCSRWGRDDHTPYIVTNSEKESAVRSRFDVCHELAHLVLHRDVEPNEMCKPEIHRLMEEQAHTFAAEFLFPTPMFLDEVHAPTLEHLTALKPKWKISIASMIMRCAELDLIKDDQKRNLFRKLARHKRGSLEPFDDQLPPESPRLLRKSIELLTDKGVIAPFQIAHDLPFRAKEIEEFASLPAGRLEDESPVYAMPTLNSKPSATSSTSGNFEPRIVRFPGKTETA